MENYYFYLGRTLDALKVLMYNYTIKSLLTESHY